MRMALTFDVLPWQYLCPSCRPEKEASEEEPVIGLDWLGEKAWGLICEGALRPHDNCSDTELYAKMMDGINQELRLLWKDEYLEVINAGLRIYALAQGSFSDARIVVQHALSGVGGVPMW